MGALVHTINKQGHRRPIKDVLIGQVPSLNAIDTLSLAPKKWIL